MWRLQVEDWVGPTRWRWRLSDPADSSVGVVEHAVVLDPTVWQFEAFTDLYQFLQWNASPDRQAEHEAQLLAEVGDWIGQQVLGPVADAIGTRRDAVRMELPVPAAVLGYRPWELARVDDRTGRRSWAAARVRVVVVPQPYRPLTKNPVGQRLRMLAVFSLPDGGDTLNLRRERFELARLVRDVAKVHGKAVELRVLQYGATRQRLMTAMLEQPGWDVVHMSGHGRAGGLVLEDEAGRPDRITSSELVDLLDLGGEQIKLVMFSACESAAVTAGEHLQLLGLAPARDTPAGARRNGTSALGGASRPEAPPAEARGDAEVLPAVASEVVGRLDCAVVAMRYPVGDEFAIGLAGSFYDLLLGKGHTVAGALATSLIQLTGPAATPTGGADRRGPAPPSVLSMVTPALFGARAADLTLTAPPGHATTVDTDTRRLAGFPSQPVRFVGRVGALTRASAVLAPESGQPGVVLHGMAGAGKTACALELAYTHQQSFPFMAWFSARQNTTDDAAGGVEVRPVLASFALATERQLPGLEWAHLVDNLDRLRAFLPELTEIMEQNRVLVVLDNIESLLTESGRWRDERWGWVLAALTGHTGLSRVVLTTRRLPTGPEAGLGAGMLVEAVHALSLAESVLLARELPRLRGLIDATRLPAGVTPETGRELVGRVLGVVQGHPKLLELADGAAADPVELQARLGEADAAWLARGTRLEGFLRGDTSAGSGEDFGAVLGGWTRAAADGLPDAAASLLRLLCGMEDDDRTPNVLSVVWPQVWEHTGQTGPAPDLVAVMPMLVARALVAEQRDPQSEPGQREVVGWRVHPGVADAVRADTDPDITTTIDQVLGDAWLGTLRDARERETQEQEGAWVVRAARSAAPYLLRRHRWSDLNHVAQQVLSRDTSVAAAANLAPMLQLAVEATRGSDRELEVSGIYARALLRLDPARGTALLEQSLQTAVDSGDYATASVLAGDLGYVYLDEGRYSDALELDDRKREYLRRTGFGPWTQINGQTQRLQILRAQGRYQEVLDGVERLRAQMTQLPDRSDSGTEWVNVWGVREAILNTGVWAARDLGLWEQALELNAETLDSMRARGASALEQARVAFLDYFSLARLGRLAEAHQLLIDCRDVYEQAEHILGLGHAYSALADVQDEWGHRDRAIDLEQQALRFKYAAGEPETIGVSHHNLASYLQAGGVDPQLVGAHRIAAAVIGYQTGSGYLPSILIGLGQLLDTPGGGRVPRSFEQVCGLVGQVPGVDLAGQLERLPQRAPDPDTAVAAVLAAAPQAAAPQAAATNAAAPDARRIEQHLTAWKPVLSALHAAVTDPDPNTRAAATTALTTALDRYADSDDWPTLAGVLRRIHAGERDPEPLLDGLDDIDTAITRHALDVLIGQADTDPTAWHTSNIDTDRSAADDNDDGNGTS